MTDTAKKPIGFYTATAIVVANMIGTGVFTSLGFQVMGIHSVFALIMLWVVGGVIALCGALCYAELGAAMPRSGGEYHYLSKIFHPSVGFLSGWISVLVGFAAPIALAAMALGSYTCAVFPSLNPTYVAATVVVLITVIQAWNVQKGAQFQAVFSTVKVILILVFIVAGFTQFTSANGGVYIDTAAWKDMTGISFFTSLIFVNYAYSGWNAAAYVAGEMDQPAKILPKSLLTGTLLVTGLYVLLNIVFIYTVPFSEMADAKGNPIIEIGAVSANHIFGLTGGNIMSIVISILLISTISAMVIAGPRVTQVIGEDMPILGFLSKKSSGGAPAIAITLQSAIALILIFTASFQSVLTYLGFTLTCFTSLTVIGLYVLRYTQPKLERPFRTKGYPITPFIFLALSLFTLYKVMEWKPTESLYGLLTIAAGLVAYFIGNYFSKQKNHI